MVDYITKYQNTYVYSHLFKYNLIDLIQRSIPCAKLFKSKILNHPINYIEWPALSKDSETDFAPYNDSMFKMRFQYKNIFPERYCNELENITPSKGYQLEQDLSSINSYDSD